MRKHDYEKEETQEGSDVLSLIPDKILTEAIDKFPFDIRTSPQQDLLFQLKRDTKRFIKTVFFTILLHLSAVTLFKVVVYVPRTDLQYVQIQFVQSELDSLDQKENLLVREQLKISQQLEELIGKDTPFLEKKITKLESKDSFQLPRLEFEELEKLQLKQLLVSEETSSRPLVEEFRDSWAQFGLGIKKIRESIIALNPFGETPLSTSIEAPLEKGIPLLKQNLGRDIELIYRWISPPYNRKVLYLPVFLDIKKNKIEQEDRSYDFLLTVNIDGQVISVSDLNIETDEIIEFLKKETEKIRFEPLLEAGGEQQVIIRFKILRGGI